MISNIDSNYKSICKLFNFSKKQKISSNFWKKKLIKLASSGAEKPKYYSSEGRRLSSYVCKTSAAYDKKFTYKIKKIRSDWLDSQEERVKKNKKMFLEMAARGEKRPNKRKDPKGAIFSSYVCPSQPTFDKKFRDQIKKINPEWIEKKSDIKKNQLLRLAKKRKSRPNWNTPLGKFFADCIYRKDRKGFDKNLYEKLKKVRPNWFVSQHQLCEKKRQEILKLAKNKKLSKKDIQKKIKTFVNYIQGKTRNDKDFVRKLKKIRPEFFVTRSQIAKQRKKEFFLLVEKNIRPNWMKKHRNRFHAWMRTDKNFRNKFLKLKPSWYKSKSNKNPHTRLV